jgi:pimeloyl-ACP methyl ester carboxylesterase
MTALRKVFGAGHWLMEEAPEKVIPELVAFLNGKAGDPMP